MAGPRGLVIAIDGVIGSGKSTAARGVAQALSYRHLDTGAMYRAVALRATARDLRPDDHDGLVLLLKSLQIELTPLDEGGRILVDGEDVSDAIRLPEITRCVGSYADRPEPKDAQLFHADFHDFKWLKLFVYLTDVTDRSGPHVMVRGSHDPSLAQRRIAEINTDDPSLVVGV